MAIETTNAAGTNQTTHSTLVNTENDKAIELRNVSYHYPNSVEESLQRINLTIEKGRFVVLMGATGAGKTTLSLCLNGLIPQLFEGKLTGDVRVAGRNVRNTPVQLMSTILGLVLQDPETQILGRTVEEDTAFGPRNISVPLEEIQQRVDHSLEKVRLKGYNHRLTEELSGGEKQRLAIAGVLAMKSEILVLDEPTSELDPAGQLEIFATLDELRRKNALTILLAVHSGEEVINRADEIIVLNQGQLVWRGEPAQLFRNIPLLLRYGIKPLPVSLIGWELYERGWISLEEIPLDISAAEILLKKLLSNHTQVTKNQMSEDVGPSWLQSQMQDQKECQLLKEKAIEIKGLFYQYKSGRNALQGINLTIDIGDFVALIGQNGAGKTTLAKHLNGLLKPSNGEVFVHGMSTKDNDISHLGKIVGYVFQNPDHQIFSTTVEKEIEYGLRNSGLTTSEIKERIQQVLQETGLEGFRHLHPFTLGKGERQMIAVASILVLNPRILIIDEPTTGTDWSGVQAMMELINRLHQAGTTIVMVSHDMDLVAQYAQRVIVLNEGRILLDGHPREVFAQEKVLADASIIPPQLCRLSLGLRDMGIQETLLHPEEFTALFERGEMTKC
ncbi:ATPase component of various ABC-type transport systems with duplicated ATPase domain [Desulfosporosinus acidiphilus SJ4]|uniref:ATPase component of various ABC-type transport systems with duplicated ATPase domain n=1 Tax=Desulfosporosinus acidiphilus (strain DSM 22704 / JCM 16185 / SJ4) TaxID=646529 RepID=I4D6F6_DESAJ|nr:energy-coupling factor transporter ATPase [Desulfosporosinus acidiphilus]AFM41380.1 ATPase component of various ABC-type transport systems with duplicated ATPase domain [Desulfosporosinus acidiphilus SJ4]